MGEIAEALRRAREERGATETEQPRPAPPPESRAPSGAAPPEPGVGPGGLHRSPARRGALAERPAARVVESLAPVDPAIVMRSGPLVEACRGLALRVREALEERGAASVALVSAVRAEGKTTVLCDLGLALASLGSGRDVALVDLDLRRPSLARVLGVPADRGVEEVLRGSATLDEVRVCVRRPALDLYPAIEAQRAAHELLVLPSFARMVGDLGQRYALVLFDTPPTLFVPDTNLILRHVSTCIPVARAGETRARYFRQLIKTLPKRHILGEILNGTEVPRYSYGYYDYADESGPSASTSLGGSLLERQP